MQSPWLMKYNLLIFDRTDSTNGEAINLAKSGVQDNFVIIADEQSAGRGQQAREWQSLIGNLHCSILLYKVNDIKHNTWQLPYIVANVVADSISSLQVTKSSKIPDIQVKWPNDILLNQKKVTGILIETLTVNNIKYLVIGIGVNISKHPKKNISYKVTNLVESNLLVNSPIDFLNTMMVNFERYFTDWKKNQSFILVKNQWLSKAHNINKAITVFDGKKRISGIFRTIGDDGALHIELSSGSLYEIFSGEIIDHHNNIKI